MAILILFPLIPGSHAAFSSFQVTPSSYKVSASMLLPSPGPVARSRTGEGGSKGAYHKVRRRYRILEFISLGSLLIIAIFLTTYLLALKKRAEEAKKVIPETYRVREIDTVDSVYTHLKELLQGGGPFKLKPEGSEKPFQGALSSVHAKEELISFHPVEPPGLDRLLEEKTPVKVEYIFDEVPYSFLAFPIDPSGEMGNNILFRVAGLIKYTQRRHSYRVKPPPLEPAHVTVAGKNGKMKETVVDISSGGTSLELHKPFFPGNEEVQVHLSLPGEKFIRLTGKVLYRLPGKYSKGNLRVGIKFTNLGMEEEKILMRYVSRSRKV
jgi:c-di-GMP-binding flagellar brake protein YcgR